MVWNVKSYLLQKKSNIHYILYNVLCIMYSIMYNIHYITYFRWKLHSKLTFLGSSLSHSLFSIPVAASIVQATTIFRSELTTSQMTMPTVLPNSVHPSQCSWSDTYRMQNEWIMSLPYLTLIKGFPVSLR